MTKCLHELEIETCSLCKPPPLNVPNFVYVTKSGQKYHRVNDCEYLYSGQEWADSKGFENHPITPMKWSEATIEYEACLLCFHGQSELFNKSNKSFKKRNS